MGMMSKGYQPKEPLDLSNPPQSGSGVPIKAFGRDIILSTIGSNEVQLFNATVKDAPEKTKIVVIAKNKLDLPDNKYNIFRYRVNEKWNNLNEAKVVNFLSFTCDCGKTHYWYEIEGFLFVQSS